MSSLDFTHIPREEFTIARCVELYEDWIAENQAIPDKIYVRMYQLVLLSPSKSLALRTDAWRGVPLQIK